MLCTMPQQPLHHAYLTKTVILYIRSQSLNYLKMATILTVLSFKTPKVNENE